MEILTNLLQFLPNLYHFLFGDKEKKIEQEFLLRKAELKMESVLACHDFELKKLDTDCSQLYNRRQVEYLAVSEVLNICGKNRGDLREKQMIAESVAENDVIYHQKMLNKHLGVFGRVLKWLRKQYRLIKYRKAIGLV